MSLLLLLLLEGTDSIIEWSSGACILALDLNVSVKRYPCMFSLFRHVTQDFDTMFHPGFLIGDSHSHFL